MGLWEVVKLNLMSIWMRSGKEYTRRRSAMRFVTIQKRSLFSTSESLAAVIRDEHIMAMVRQRRYSSGKHGSMVRLAGNRMPSSALRSWYSAADRSCTLDLFTSPTYHHNRNT